MHLRQFSRLSTPAIALSSALVSLVLGAAATADTTTAPPVQILPAAGSSQTFSVSTHLDAPSGGGHFHGSGPGGPGNAPQNESGTMVVKRTDVADAEITLSGVSNASDATHPVTGQTADAGSPPDPYIVTLDNAAAIAAGAPATLATGATWTANVQTLDPGGTVNTVAVNAVVTTASGGAVSIHATGKTTETFSTPHGDRSADEAIDITESIAGSRLTEFDQKVSRTIQGHMGSFTFSATTSLKSS
jgi:hypothetical protein